MNAQFDVTGIVIETPRVTLREWREDDLEDLYEYASVDGVGQMAGWEPHGSVEDSKKILDRFIEGKHVFAVVLKENGKVIGSVGIEQYGSEDKLTEFAGYKGRELGFVLSKDYWGRGLMPEAAGAAVDYCFNTLDFDFMLCGHFNFNMQSKRVQEKLGFVPYRSLVFDTSMGTKEPGTLNLLINPKKKLKLEFSHPETLILTFN